MSNDYDVIVIGAGAGGLCTAARLQHQGYRTLVVERLDKVGGRASTTDVDGFKVNDGAIVIEVGGITERTCHEVGAPFDIREPNPPILYRIRGKDVDVTGGGWGFLLQKLTRQGAKVVGGIGAARKDEGLPEERDDPSRVGLQVHEERGRPRDLPQHGRVGLRGRFGRPAGARVPHLLHPQVAPSSASASTPRARSGSGRDSPSAIVRDGGEVRLSTDGRAHRPRRRSGHRRRADRRRDHPRPGRGQQHRACGYRRAARRGATCPPTTRTR